MFDIKIIYCSEYDEIEREGVLIKKLTHNGNDLALIFYPEWIAIDHPPYFEDDDGDIVCEPLLAVRFVFRYVDISHGRLTIYDNEKSKYTGETEDELIEKYGGFGGGFYFNGPTDCT